MAKLELSDLPDPTQEEGAPHPRDCPRLFGQGAAEAQFLAAAQAGRLHHAWLLTGPKGIGKASLAWRIARFLLAGGAGESGPSLFSEAPPLSLDMPADHPVAHRLATGAAPDFFLLRRGMNSAETGLSADIRVDDLRKMKSFFTLSAADGGERVALIDCADELNTAAANALLKLLEEPPPRSHILLVSHQPQRLLPTIRSRCQGLRLSPLSAPDLAAALAALGTAPAPAEAAALAALAGGSVGVAFQLTAQEGLALYARLTTLLSAAPRLPRPELLALADLAAGRKDSGGAFELLTDLLDRLLARAARRGAFARDLPEEAAPGERAMLARLSPGPAAGRLWAGLAQSLGQRARAGRAVNLDPSALVMDMLLAVEAAAKDSLLLPAGP